MLRQRTFESVICGMVFPLSHKHLHSTLQISIIESLDFLRGFKSLRRFTENIFFVALRQMTKPVEKAEIAFTAGFWYNEPANSIYILFDTIPQDACVNIDTF